jgi:hypothetical protein
MAKKLPKSDQRGIVRKMLNDELKEIDKLVKEILE